MTQCSKDVPQIQDSRGFVWKPLFQNINSIPPFHVHVLINYLCMLSKERNCIRCRCDLDSQRLFNSAWINLNCCSILSHSHSPLPILVASCWKWVHWSIICIIINQSLIHQLYPFVNILRDLEPTWGLGKIINCCVFTIHDDLLQKDQEPGFGQTHNNFVHDGAFRVTSMLHLMVKKDVWQRVQ